MSLGAGQPNGLIVYLIRAFAVIGGAYVLLYVVLPSTLSLDLPEGLTLALAAASGGVLRALGVPAVQVGPLVDLPGGWVVVTDLCNGIGEWLLLAGAMLALQPVPWRIRLLGVVGGGLVLMALNVLRIALLAYLRAAASAWFAPVHQQLAPLALVLTAIGCFVLWLRGVGRELIPQ